LKFITREIFFSGANQIWRFVYGPLLLIFIPLFLSPEHQGFWFTFVSISALSVFADLGFNNIVMQFSSHEAAFAEFKNHTITGDSYHIERLGSLFKYVQKWTVRASFISFPVIFILGCVIYHQKSSSYFWLIPWILYLFGSALIFITNSMLSFFEGCHQLGTVQKIRLYTGIIYSGTLILLLIARADLYALALAMIFNAMVMLLFIFIFFGKYMHQLRAASKKINQAWSKDILKLLWKYAISWSSGYLIFQIYTPLMFQFHGPVLAGKVGITISMWTAMFSLSNVWIYVSTPKMNMNVARKQWHALDKTFIRSLLLSAGTFIIGIMSLFIFLSIVTGKFTFIDGIVARFLPIIPVIFLGTGWFFQLLINGMAAYLRAHKEEPLLYISIISAAIILTTTLLAAKYLPPDYFFAGFTGSYLWGIPIITWIFFKKREQWHNPS
jgi:hypothetical protein